MEIAPKKVIDVADMIADIFEEIFENATDHI